MFSSTLIYCWCFHWTIHGISWRVSFGSRSARRTCTSSKLLIGARLIHIRESARRRNYRSQEAPGGRFKCLLFSSHTTGALWRFTAWHVLKKEAVTNSKSTNLNPLGSCITHQWGSKWNKPPRLLPFPTTSLIPRHCLCVASPSAAALLWSVAPGS